MSKRLIECVPNFSEGRDKNVIAQITSAIESAANVKLLNVDPGEATNRTVVTFVGEPEEVLPMNMPTGLDGVTAEDYGFCVLKYKNGVSFAKTCACEVGGFLRRQLVVTGSKGTYEIRPWELPCEGGQTSPARWTPLTDKVRAWGTDVSEKLDFPPCDRYDNMMKSFAEIVRGAKNPYTPDYELKLFRLVMKCCGYSE